MRAASHPPWLSSGWSCFILFSISLCISPYCQETTDVTRCWLKWSVASGGLRPWAIYAANPDCNYPPFVLYFLTATQALIRLLHADQTGPLAVCLVKLPNLISCLAGVWICRAGMRPLTDSKTATRAALGYAWCLALWFNAAVWGQWDALSSLAMVAAVLAVANDRPAWAGAAVGWALSIKLHAIVILPAIGIYLLRRWSPAFIAISCLTMVMIWSAISAPFFLAGQGHPLLQSYTGAINFYPGLSEGAFNLWQLVHLYNLRVLHQSEIVAGFDGQIIFGILTARRVGLILFAVYTLWLSVGLIRRPTKFNLMATAGLTAVAFFMLPTQVHQRYLVPAAALLSLVAVLDYGWTYLLVMVAALVNQWVVMEYERQTEARGFSASQNELFIQIYCILSAVNLLGFAWISWHHHRRLTALTGLPASAGGGITITH